MFAITSCKKTIRGCTDSNASNDDVQANENDGSCKYTGQVTFWTNANLGSNITVTIGGQTGFITGYFSTYNPTCGSNGCANFTLNTNSYSYYATSSVKT